MTKHYRVKIEYDHWLGAVAAVVLSKFNHGVTGELWGLVRLASSELGWYRNQGLGAPSHTGDGSFVGIVQPGAASVPALLRWLFHVFFFGHGAGGCLFRSLAVWITCTWGATHDGCFLVVWLGLAEISSDFCA